MKKILVAVDGSECAFKALSVAAEMAKHADVPLVVANVVAPSPYVPTVYADTLAKIAAEARRFSEEIIHQAAQKAEAQGVSCERVSLQGAPAEVLAEFAENPDIWLVVVGSHGKGAFARILLGSVAHRLVHICKKPVLVVRD